MPDRFTANLPSADFDRTVGFYAVLGMEPAYRDSGWLILQGNGLELEFFSAPIDPFQSWHSACLRVRDLDEMYARCGLLELPDDGKSIPRLGGPRAEASGVRIFYLLDPDGSLIRCIETE